MTSYAMDKIMQQLGDPVDVDRELREFRRTARVFSSQRPRLIERYPKQWVAVYDGKVKARGRTLTSVLHQVRKQNLSPEHVLIRYIDKTERTMIL